MGLGPPLNFFQNFRVKQKAVKAKNRKNGLFFVATLNMALEP